MDERVLYLPVSVLEAYEAAEPSYFNKDKTMAEKAGPGHNVPRTIQEEAIELIRYFVMRVEQGTIRSKVTYQKYKKFLNEVDGLKKGL